VNEHGGVVAKNRERVGGEIPGVVGFGAGKTPTVTDPREGFGVADVKRVADQGGAGESGGCEDESCAESDCVRESFEFHDDSFFLDGTVGRRDGTVGRVLTGTTNSKLEMRQGVGE
jgi:hypothetical protein